LASSIETVDVDFVILDILFAPSLDSDTTGPQAGRL
jgi:hypothetical protein